MSGAVVSALLLSFLMVASSGDIVAIHSSNPQPFGRFGSSIDSANGLLAVGAPGELANASSSRVSGLVYLFNAKTGSLIRTLSSPHPYCTGLGGCAFGSSVRLGGRYLIVGAPGQTVNGIELAGEVFVFNAHSGSLLRTLVSPNPEFDGFFGSRVAEENGRVYVGASIESVNGFHAAGHVYVFNIETGSFIATITSPSPESGGVFGIALDVSGGRLIVGAEEGPPPPCEPSFCSLQGQGRAYVFNATTGLLISTLLPTYQTQFFGNSVAIQNQLAFVGANAETVGGVVTAGRVYLYNATTGSVIRTLVSPNQRFGARFGVSLAVATNDVIIGELGRVYVFDPTTGILRDTIVSPDASSPSSFGLSIAVAKNRVSIGAPYETVNGQDIAGAVFVFSGIFGPGQSDSKENQP